MVQDGRRFELAEGVLLVSPAPSPRHQRCVAALTARLYAAEADGAVVLPAPCEWMVDAGTIFQPDVLVVRREDLHETAIRGIPLLVVEVLSQSTRLTDLGAKRTAFETAGVPAYWVVDPDVPTLTVLRLEQGRLVETARVIGNEPYRALFPFPVTIVPATLVDGA
ncbi:MAG TPA: Uma2 family endonuclease [Verrucomicrobiae bacterium]|nr:Uma2 family endonuclease [Verrucomicrobiae bacterium]